MLTDTYTIESEAARNAARTAPMFHASLMSPKGEMIEIYKYEQWGDMTMLRYDPAKGETREMAWLNGGCDTALIACLPICGNGRFNSGRDLESMYQVVGRLIVRDRWTRIQACGDYND